MDGFLTIKEFAEKAGVSPQAIAKQTRNPNSKITPYKKTVNNKVYISVSALLELYGIGSTEETPDNPHETQLNPEKTEKKPEETTEKPEETEGETPINPDNKPAENKEYIDYLLQEIQELKAELREKDLAYQQSIMKKDDSIAELTQQVIALSNKIAGTALISAMDSKEIAYTETGVVVYPKGTEPQKKRGFFSRLFGR